MTTQSRYVHSIALSQEEEERLRIILKAGYKIIQIFKAGLKLAEEKERTNV